MVEVLEWKKTSIRNDTGDVEFELQEMVKSNPSIT